MNKQRENWIDAVKGFTIYLMVLGHCIQYATPLDYRFENNEIFRLIYGFHMPLFMIISGYLFWYTLNRYDLKKGVISKIKGIAIPCFAWGFVTYVCDIIAFDYYTLSLLGYINYTLYSNWFLWAIMYCSVYGFISKYLFKNSLWGYILIIFINFLIPDFGNYAGAKRLLPFFVMGILICRYKIIEKINDKQLFIFIFAAGSLYIVSVWFNMCEMVTGTLGSSAVILLFYSVSSKIRIIPMEKLGRVSISIYLFTGIMFYFIIKEYFRISDSYRYLIKAGYVFVLSIVIIILAYLVSCFLKKFKITNGLFLGIWNMH